MRNFSKRGSIIIAIMFSVVLTLVTVIYLRSLSGRGPFLTNQLKRAQAVYCAEAALYEVFNRVRAGTLTPPNNGNPIIINVPVVDAPATVPVTVRFSGTTPPYRVDAEVNYNNINM